MSGYAMMNRSTVFPEAAVSTESRPVMIERRLQELLSRLGMIAHTADALCIGLSGTATLSPEVANRPEGPPNLGLYSNIFMAIDQCMVRCEEIEVALREAGR